MIRPALFGDLPRLYALMDELHSCSTFAERGIGLNARAVQQTMMEGVRRNGGSHAGSTLLNVVEFRDELEGFMLGGLQPIYGVCLELEAIDRFLYTTKKAPKIAASLLVGAYVDWAAEAELVRDIYLSWTDVVGVDGNKLAKLYSRKGFERCGEIWRRGAR